MKLPRLLRSDGLGITITITITLAHLGAAQVLWDQKPVSPGRRWSALGDSYSAGVGAGFNGGGPMNDRPGENCYRRSGAFPMQLNESPSLSKDSSNIEFSFLACTGAVTADLLGDGPNAQIKLFNNAKPAEEEVVTITIGGNDVGFGNIASVCLYGNSFSGLNCEEEKAKTRQKLETIEVELIKTYKAIIKSVIDAKGASKFLIYVIGYPKFFSDEMTDECNDFHFGVLPFSGPNLEVALRTEINDMVDTMNQKIRKAVETVNLDEGFERVRYIDADAEFEGHRFCEPGQGHPSKNNPLTWFFMFGGDDMFGDDPDGQVPLPVPSPPIGMTPQECVAILTKQDISMGDELGRVLYCLMMEGESQGIAPPPWLQPGAQGISEWEIFMRIFHPKSSGHEAIQKAISRDLDSLPEKRLYPVLVMYSGTKDSFEGMISSLESLFPTPALEFGGTRVTQRWEKDGTDVRGYSTWLTALQGWKVSDGGDSRFGGVLGVSFEPRLQLAPAPPPESPASASDFMMHPHNHSGVPERHQQEPRVLSSRQVSTDEVELQFNPEDGHDFWHLKYLSQPPRLAGQRYYEYPGYTYQNRGGRRVDIYILDTGLIPSISQELDTSPPGGASRIPRTFEAVGTRQGRGDLVGHGTMMASLAAGRRAGVARAANIIPVKFHENSNPSYYAAHLLFQSLQWILSDRKTVSRREFIVNYSFGSSYLFWMNPMYSSDKLEKSDPWFHLLPLLNREGGIVVCSAGNTFPDGLDDARSGDLTPGRYAKPGYDGVETLIVVGATDEQGRVAGFSNKFTSIITVYAPGSALTALVPGDQLLRLDYGGTSAAAALTSGTIATFLSRPDLDSETGIAGGASLLQIVKNVKIFVQKAASYATNPDKGDIHVIGTYDYIPCQNEDPQPNIARPRPTIRVVNGETTTVWGVPGLACPGYGPDRGLDGYKYVGCVHEAGAPTDPFPPHQLRFLHQVVPSGQGVKWCADKCYTEYQLENAVLVGLRNGMCYCDANPLNPPAINIVPEQECNRPCPDHKTICGGSNRLSLYSTTGTITWQTDVTDWQEIGCYLQIPDGRFPTQGKWGRSSELTPNSCAQFCSGLTYFGLQRGPNDDDGNLCYCGNVLHGIDDRPDGEEIDGRTGVKACNKACPGDGSSLCGGEFALSIYMSKRPRIQLPVGGVNWRYTGCFRDASTRLLVGASYSPLNNLTPRLCREKCQGWRYFGVEAGNECYCGNELDLTKQAAEFSCDWDCSGDRTLACGGNWRLGVWEDMSWTDDPRGVQPPDGADVDGYGFAGCRIDADDRALKGASHGPDPTLTPLKCARLCCGFAFFGVENGNECYCGDSLDAPVAPITDCATACSGDPSIPCGGGWRIAAYEEIDAGSCSSTSTTSTRSSSSPTRSSSFSTSTIISSSSRSSTSTSSTTRSSTSSTSTSTSTRSTITTTTSPTSTTATTASTTSPAVVCPTSQPRCTAQDCQGTFADGQAQCRTQARAGCSCIPSSDTPGYQCPSPSTACDANNCAGTFDANGSGPTCKNFAAGCRCAATTQMCGTQQSCDLNDCNGSFDSDGFATCKTAFTGCRCTPTPRVCRTKQSCGANNCNGSFDSDGVARCKSSFAPCECVPTTQNCGAQQSCDLNNCNGSFDSDGFATCKDSWAGCRCTPSPRVCGTKQSCGLNNCNGSFDSDGIARCKSAFAPCECIPTPQNCGAQQSCDLNNCMGSFDLSNGFATCKNWWSGCRCNATPGTCGASQSCDLNNCNGSFDADGRATCKGFFAGCRCEPTPRVCGQMESCDLNGCNGSYEPSSNVARCRGNFSPCQCNPTTNTCGNPVSCDLNGCAGSYDGNSNVARCRNNFAGCVCNPTPNSCGSPQPCDRNGCDGTFDAGSNTARCRRNFNGCVCTPVSSSCGNPLNCDLNGCAGTYDGFSNTARCRGNFAGCVCRPVPSTCGALQSCEANGCGGIYDANSGVATCRNFYQGCQCARSGSTPIGCGTLQSCSFGDCNGRVESGQNLGICQSGSHRGCSCVPSSPPPAVDPPPCNSDSSCGCGSSNQAFGAHCETAVNSMSTSDQNFAANDPSRVSGCSQSGEYRYCDLSVSQTCKISVGWRAGGNVPTINSAFFRSTGSGQLWRKPCAIFRVGVNNPQGTNGYVFCMIRTGTACTY